MYEQQFDRDRVPESSPDDFAETKSLLSSVTDRYQLLKTSCEALLSQLNQVDSAYDEFNDTSRLLNSWIDSVRAIGSGPIDGMDLKSLQDELSRVKALSAEAAMHGRDVEKMRAAAQTLVSAGAGDDSLQVSVEGIAEKVMHISDAANAHCSDLQTAIVQSQGVQDGVDALLNWIRNSETSLNALSRPFVIDQESAASQLDDITSLLTDIENHADSINTMNKAATSQSDAASAAVTSDKLRELNARFDSIKSQCLSRKAVLGGLTSQLSEFHEAVRQFDDWTLSVFDELDSKVTLTEEQRQQIVDDVGAHRTDLDRIKSLANEIANNPAGSDARRILDSVAGAEHAWDDLNEALASQEREGALRHQRSNQFADLKRTVVNWLDVKERTVEALEPVPVNLKDLDQQIEELTVSYAYALCIRLHPLQYCQKPFKYFL